MKIAVLEGSKRMLKCFLLGVIDKILLIFIILNGFRYRKLKKLNKGNFEQ